MKKLICFGALLAAIAAITTGCPGPESEPKPDEISVTFTEATLEYYFAEETGMEADMFVFEFFAPDKPGVPYLGIEFTSDSFEEALSALPASGTYNHIIYNSSGDGVKFTFQDAEYYESYDDENGIAVTGGSFSIVRTDYNYTVLTDFKLENGKVLKGKYEGSAYPFLGGKEDVAVDFNKWGWTVAEAYEIPGHEGMLQIYLGVEPDWNSGIEILLTINTEAGLTELPAGNYTMAAEARKGIPGVAEPASIYKEDIEMYDPLGCWYYYNSDDGDSDYGLYAVPGKGFVNIGKEGDTYTFEFSYTTPAGKTVSGNYTGDVDFYGDDDDYYTRSQTRGGQKARSHAKEALNLWPSKVVRK